MRTKAKRPEAGRYDLAEQLRDAIGRSGLTAYAVAQAAGVDPGVVSRFATGERDLRLETAGRIAGALGLRLAGGRAGRPPKPTRQGPLEPAGSRPDTGEGPPA